MDTYKKIDIKMFIAALILIAVSFAVTVLMYTKTLPDNFIVWFTYPASVICLLVSCRKYITFKFSDIKTHKGILIGSAAVTLIYFLFHLYKCDTAPWNNFGLFDDAAWDIFDARLKCFNGKNFEIIFFDSRIGGISRELVFHYYITFFFRLFGFNLAVFNAALNILGWITVLFTFLSVKEMTDNIYIAICTSVTLTVFPLHYTQVYMGHRYAICAPLMMIALYFIVRAVKRGSLPSAAAGGVFAGLTMASSIMGKQFIWGLLFCCAVYGLFFLIVNRSKLADHLSVALMGLAGYAAGAAPLYAYIVTHREQYNIRQESMTKDFFLRIKENGMEPVIENLKALSEVLFGKESGLRQFSPGYPVFPWFYIVCFVLGVVFLLMHKKIASIVFAMIPIAGCVIALAYDFRILISAPFICFIIVYGIFGVAELIMKFAKAKKLYGYIGAAAVTVILMFPQISYITGLADDPNSLMHLPHHSVAISRYMQDLAIGAEVPSIEMKKEEFNLGNTNDKYDLYIAIKGTYGHLHAFLGEESSREILKLTGDFPYVGQTDEDIRRNVYGTIQGYEPGDKDLMLAFEYSDRVEQIISELEGTGVAEVKHDSRDIDGREVSVCTVYITKDNIQRFKDLTAQYSFTEDY